MDDVVAVWKPQGLTPLEMVELYKEKFGLEKTVSYAGRLDPMAEGILLLLIGEANKRREEFQKMPKEYEVDIVFGITTDTYDGMGLVTSIQGIIPEKEDVKDKIKEFEGEIVQEYPPYSSKPVNGHPLYWWARENRLSEIKIPTHAVIIEKIIIDTFEIITAKSLVENIIGRVKKVEGNFRQGEIVSMWGHMHFSHQEQNFLVAKISVRCTSGTYMRSIASDLGKRLTCGAFALGIRRTKIGRYSRESCVF